MKTSDIEYGVTRLGQGTSTESKPSTPEEQSIKESGMQPIYGMNNVTGNRVLMQLFLYCERCGAPLDCVSKGHGRVEVNCIHVCEPTQKWKHIEKRGSRG